MLGNTSHMDCGIRDSSVLRLPDVHRHQGRSIRMSEDYQETEWLWNTIRTKILTLSCFVSVADSVSDMYSCVSYTLLNHFSFDSLGKCLPQSTPWWGGMEIVLLLVPARGHVPLMGLSPHPSWVADWQQVCRMASLLFSQDLSCN
jgi:hypothetical protein